MSNTFFLPPFVRESILRLAKLLSPHRRAQRRRPERGPWTGTGFGRFEKDSPFAPTDLANSPTSKFHVWGLAGLLLSLFLLASLTGCGPKQVGTILDAEDQFALAKREFEEKQYEKANIEFQKLIFNYPGAVFIDSAQYLLAMSNFNQEDYFLAVAEFNKLISSFPTSQLSDDAAFMVALCDFKMSARAELDQNHTEQAIEELQNFLDDYPTSDRAKEAQDLLRESRSKLAKKAYKNGRLYFNMRKYDAALIYLEEVVNGFHDTEWLAPAQFQIAEVYFRQKKYDRAKEEYEKFLENFPQDRLAKKAKQRLEKLNSGTGHAGK